MNFEENDKLERLGFSKNLTNAITKFYPLHDESYVVSLNAPYGSGKTTFLKMWQESIKDKHHVIYINAWETDFDEEPIIPIISALLKEIDKKKNSIPTEVIKSFKEAIGASALILNELSPVDFYKVFSKVEEEYIEKNLEDIGNSIYKNYSFKVKAYEELKKALPKYIDFIKAKPLIILIDELDRVRPSYAVDFLEAIKHLFSIHGICFVIAIDRKQLEASVEKTFGNIDFENYYQRFVTTEINLPKASEKCIAELTDHTIKSYFDEKKAVGYKLNFDENDKNKIYRYLADLCNIFEFRPRTQKRFLRSFAQLNTVSHDSTEATLTSWVEALALLIAISFKDKSFYKQLGNDNFEVSEAVSFLKNLNFKSTVRTDYRYLMLTILAFSDKDGNNQNKKDDIIAEAKKYLQSGDKADIGGVLASFKNPNSWNSFDAQSGFERLYTKIEEWKEFI